MAYTIAELKTQYEKSVSDYDTQVKVIENLKSQKDSYFHEITTNCHFRKDKIHGWQTFSTVPPLTYTDIKNNTHPESCYQTVKDYNNKISQINEASALLVKLKSLVDTKYTDYNNSLATAQQESTINLYQELGQTQGAKETQTNIGTIAVAVTMLIVLFIAIKVILK